jgi:hypothetical protein
LFFWYAYEGEPLFESYFVRHAERQPEILYDHLKHQDSPITEQGKIRAKILHTILNLGNHVVYASEYLRTQTPRASQQKKWLEIFVDSVK